MALFEYMQRTQLLLDDQSFEKVNEEDVIRWINMARGQIAGQSECIRFMATLAVTAPTQVYAFSSISLSGATGVQGVLNVRQVTYSVAQGAKFVHPRSFPYFNLYYLSQPVPQPGAPSVWSQYGQGALGSLYINVPDQAYTLNVDTVCYPNNLTLDTDAEAIPYIFTDAVPLFAAYYAAMTFGDKDRAAAMYQEYEKYVARGRQGATPGVLPTAFAQPPDPFMASRLGTQPKGQA